MRGMFHFSSSRDFKDHNINYRQELAQLNVIWVTQESGDREGVRCVLANKARDLTNYYSQGPSHLIFLSKHVLY
jgi:hypothetical protein